MLLPSLSRNMLKLSTTPKRRMLYSPEASWLWATAVAIAGLIKPVTYFMPHPQWRPMSGSIGEVPHLLKPTRLMLCTQHSTHTHGHFAYAELAAVAGELGIHLRQYFFKSAFAKIKKLIHISLYCY